MVVIVKHGIGETLCHMADLLRLRHKIEGAVLYILQYVRRSIRTVQVHIALLLVHESHIPHRLEKLPGGDEILHHADVGAGFNVEISGIEISSHVQTRDELERLVFRVGGRSLPVEVEVVCIWRRLEITLLERLAVPYPICLVHKHMIHMDRHPDVRSGIGNLVIHLISDYEIVGLHISVLQEINSRLVQLAEVELHIIVFIVRSPRAYFPSEHLFCTAVILHLPNGST